ncbi:Blastoderm-specific protein 25D [Papilio xuthus]|uniref:Blastoderm-specific protein 25D n=1 Tax=Papilio xuthus TaxID=66420 RepID=A0A194PVA6_PAPXU|nr:Blastoderm-specific protein 25D [Papilio xuthus]
MRERERERKNVSSRWELLKESEVYFASELESSYEQLKREYEQSEEYWAGKVEEEREACGEELRAADERLAELVARIAEYERQFTRAPLPAIEERAALEHQVTALEDEFAAYRRDAEARRAAAGGAAGGRRPAREGPVPGELPAGAPAEAALTSLASPCLSPPLPASPRRRDSGAAAVRPVCDAARRGAGCCTTLCV